MNGTEPSAEPVDGRSVRWAGHREARRRELVEATLRALRRYGAGVGIGEVAAVAGTSKTVLYRHFADREELYLAVCQRVAERLVGELRAAVANARTPRGMLSAAIDAYLQLIERDPEVYRFVVHQPLERPVGRDPVAGLLGLAGEQVAQILTDRLAARGRRTAPARPWAYGVVGMVHAAADDWLEHEPRSSRAVLTRQLTDLAWGGLSGVLGES